MRLRGRAGRGRGEQPGAVDPDIDGAERGFHAGDKLPDLCRIGDIAGERLCRTAIGDNRIGHDLRLGFIAAGDDRDLGSLGGEQRRVNQQVAGGHIFEGRWVLQCRGDTFWQVNFNSLKGQS